MTADPIASRRFEACDQEFFARLSGDWNPMHLDPVVARRTQAGAPVVHGMHLLLWSLETLSSYLPAPLYLESLKADFQNFLYVSDQAECILQTQGVTKLKWQVVANGVAVLKASATVATMPVEPLPDVADSVEPVPVMAPPNEITFDQAAQLRGDISFAEKTEVVAAAFPRTAAIIGARRVAAIAGSSRLVGMVCPGLHSVFGSISLAFGTSGDQGGGLRYEVAEADERFRLLRILVSGAGTAGTIEAFMRSAPIQQPTLPDIASVVHPGEFAGETALVIGASRGLGELTAKIIACGSGRLIGTYVSGHEEADALAREIQEFGGECQILKYDALLPPADQLKEMKWPPTQLFYFATPKIFRQKGSILDRALLNHFLDFYVDSFFDLCRYLLTQTSTPISIYYPSSIAIDSRPNNLTEYAMAKAAGEIVCDDLRRLSPRLRILHTRLPRLATDQTSAIGAEAPPPALPELLTVIRKLRQNGASSISRGVGQ
jgi:acyl dehydratase